MGWNYGQHFSTQVTSQSEPIPGRELDMVSGKAGGYIFPVDDWTQLDRFLILGSCSTYYSTEKELTVENAQAVLRCIQADGVRVVRRVAEISAAGRAFKNDPALFVLAMASAHGNAATKQAVKDCFNDVVRIGTHLFHINQYRKAFGGWGRMWRTLNANWYNERDAGHIDYQVAKYQQRDGWSHADILKLAHPVPATENHNAIFRYILHPDNDAPTGSYLEGMERAQGATMPSQWVQLISDYKLTREMLPTEALNSSAVWEALLTDMPMTAMIRNLGKMSQVGLLAPLSAASTKICAQLRNEDSIRKARVHPLSILVALRTYQQGHGVKGKLSWEPVSQVVDALDDAFYLAFGNVPSTGKATMLALDVSGSMRSPMSNLPLSCRDAAAAMAMVIARSEPQYVVTIFSSAGTDFHLARGGWSGSGISTFDISPRERLDDVIRRTSNLGFGGTDCALPMLYANDRKLLIDTFVVLTDSETWAGNVHPSQALTQYRQKSGRQSRLVVVGMTSNGFSIADPRDAGQLDVVGFDTATPQLISEFSVGNI